MPDIVKAFESYIYEDIGVSVTPCKRVQTSSLPYFILDEYLLYRTYILQKECILLVPKTSQEMSPATIRKHIKTIQDKQHEVVVYLSSSVSSYNRKRLIEYKVPFVIPGNQMYLPDLMIDLRDHFFKVRSGKTKFSPATHALIVYILHHFREQPLIPTAVAKKLGYTSMTMTRSFDELEEAGLGHNSLEGRERWLWIHDNRPQFWERALPYLKSPVQKEIGVPKLPEELMQIIAGETALAEYSMLAPPIRTTFAALKKDWNFYKRRDTIEIVNSIEESNYILQLWSYDPFLFLTKGFVDKFSLFLSLKENEDERIQIALEKMMESIVW